MQADPLNSESMLKAIFSPQALFAVLAILLFTATVVHQDNIRLSHQSVEFAPSAVLDSPYILKLAQQAAPSRLAASGRMAMATSTALQLVKSDPNNIVNNICAGNVFIASGASDQGLALLKKSVTLAPNSKYIRLNYAQKLALCKHYDEASTEFADLIAKNPTWMEPHIAYIDVLLVQENYALAAEQLRSAIKLERNMGSLHKVLGIVLGRNGETKPAMDEYMEGINRENQTGVPESVKDLIASSGTIDRAVYQIEQQADQRPDDYYPKLILADLLLYLGQVRDAKEILLEARRLAPNNPDVHLKLAIVFKRLGETDQALSEFMMGVSLGKAQAGAQPLHITIPSIDSAAKDDKLDKLKTEKSEVPNEEKEAAVESKQKSEVRTSSVAQPKIKTEIESKPKAEKLQVVSPSEFITPAKTETPKAETAPAASENP